MDRNLKLGELQFTDRMFLGNLELNRLQRYLIDKTRLILQFGGAGFLDKEDYLVTRESNRTILLPESICIDSEGNILYSEERSITIPQSPNQEYTIIISKGKTPLEKGKVRVSNVNGESLITGSSTEFEDIIRPFSPYKTSRISFRKDDNNRTPATNNGDYLVNSYDSESQTITSYDNLSEESGEKQDLKYAVIPAFSQDTVPSDSDKYIYLNYNAIVSVVQGSPDQVSIYDSLTNTTTLQDIDNSLVFRVASVQLDSEGNISSNDSITDLRSVFYKQLNTFVIPKEWEEVIINSSLFQLDSEKLSVRFNQLSNLLEIRGRFLKNESGSCSSGTLVATLPNSITVTKDSIIRSYNLQTNEEVLLKVSGSEISVLKADTIFSTGTGTNSNLISSQLITLD